MYSEDQITFMIIGTFMIILGIVELHEGIIYGKATKKLEDYLKGKGNSRPCEGYDY